MSAITISRKLGSYGGSIAERLASELGWKFADSFFINSVISEYGLVRLSDLYDKAPTLLDLFNENTLQTIEWMNKTAVALAAKNDVVILGRGGFAALKGHSDVFNVLVTAPEEERIRRVAHDNRESMDAAREMVKRDENTKTRFVRRYYGQNWADPDSYDLVIDTAALSEDKAIQLIIGAAKDWFKAAEGPRVADAEVDPLLVETVEKQFALQTGGSGL